MPFSFKKLGKFITLPFRKNRQNESAITSHDGGAVPADIPGDLPSPALPSDSPALPSDSPALPSDSPALPSDSPALLSDSPALPSVFARIERRVQVCTPSGSDRFQLALHGMQGIPLAGGPLQAAINGLWTILQTIDRHAQNKAAICSLRIRLSRLWRYLCNAPSAHDGAEQSRRDELISLLQDISDQLTELHNGGLGYQSVTQALDRFSTELDHYLAEYTFAAQMHTQNYVVEFEAQLRQFRGSAAMDLPGTVTRHCMTLVDATGQEHKIPMEFCMSRRVRLGNVLRKLSHASIQRRFMEEGQYDLCIDQGTQVVELTNETNGWSIEAGTKVLMRVIIKKVVNRDSTIKCDACGYSGLSVKSAGTKGHGYWTIECKRCDRRYQISDPSWARSGAGLTAQATDSATMDLIRNMHVQENLASPREESFEVLFLPLRLREQRVRNLIVRARYTMVTEPLPCPTLSCKKRHSNKKCMISFFELVTLC